MLITNSPHTALNSLTLHPIDLLYVGTLPPHAGGSAILGATLLNCLSRKGHRVRAIAPTDEPSTLDLFAKRHPELEVSRYSVPFLTSSSNALPCEDYQQQEKIAIIRSMEDRLSERRPDIIIAGRESFARQVPGVARRLGIPCLLIVHGGRTLERLIQDPTAPAQRSLLECFQAADAIIAVAHHLANALRPLCPGRIEVIPNPVDLARFATVSRNEALAASLELTSDDIVVLHLSKFSSIKRPLDVVLAAERALARDPRLKFVMVGDGPLLKNVRAACQARGLSERFRFTGWIEHRDVHLYLSLANLVIASSRSEGQSLVHLETMASGQTLIVSDTPGARELIKDGSTGLLYPVGDIVALSQKIVFAAARPTMRSTFGRRAQEWVRDHDLHRISNWYEASLRALT